MIIADRAVAIFSIAKVDLNPEIRQELNRLENDLRATVLTERRALVQAFEIVNISLEADAIEADLIERGLELPSAFSIFTAGLKPPADSSQVISRYGQGAYQGFFPAGIAGHECQTSMVTLPNSKTMMVFEGRSLHGYESTDLQQAPIVIAHGLRAIKELVRRQRARGIDAPVILTFLTGADFEAGDTQVGEMGLFLDDTELGGTDHSGAGAHDLLDVYDGNRFVGKAGKSAHSETATMFKTIAGKFGLKIHPAVGVGTPGAPEFQSVFERSLIKMAFDKALESELLNKIIQPIFGSGWQEKTSLLFNMSVTTELAVFRALKKGEPPIRVLPLSLATDLVGNEESLEIDHGLVFARALEEASKYIPAIIEFANSASMATCSQGEDFSIRAKLIAEGVYTCINK